MYDNVSETAPCSSSVLCLEHSCTRTFVARQLLQRLATDCATYAELVGSRRVPLVAVEGLQELEALLRETAKADQEKTLSLEVGQVVCLVFQGGAVDFRWSCPNFGWYLQGFQAVCL